MGSKKISKRLSLVENQTNELKESVEEIIRHDVEKIKDDTSKLKMDMVYIKKDLQTLKEGQKLHLQNIQSVQMNLKLLQEYILGKEKAS